MFVARTWRRLHSVAFCSIHLDLVAVETREANPGRWSLR